MAAARKLEIIIAGDAKGALGAFDSVEKGAGKTGGAFAKLSGKAKLALAGMGAGAVAFGKSSVDAFIEAEASQAKLTDAWEKFDLGPGLAQLREFNSELAKKTKFDDDATASGQAVLAQFGLEGDQIMSLTTLMQDYAAKTGKTLPQAAQVLGKAVLGNGKALKGIGLNFKDTGNAADNYAQIVDGLTAKVGGFAEKEGKTTSGRLAIMKNQFGELQETVGSKLVPILTSLVSKLVSLGDWLSKHKPVLIAAAAVIGTGLVIAFTAWATSAAAAAAATIAATAPVIAIGAAVALVVAAVVLAYQKWEFFRTVVDAVASFLTDTLWPAIQTGVSWLVDHLGPAVTGVAGFFKDSLFPAIQVVWDIIANKVVPVIVTVIEKWVEFEVAIVRVAATVIEKVAAIAGKFIGFVADIATVVAAVIEKLAEIVTFVAGLPQKVVDAAKDIWHGIQDGVEDAVKFVLKWLDKLLGPLDEIVGKVAGLKGLVGGHVVGVNPNAGKPPQHRASGGWLGAGDLSWVGERGPELIRMGARGGTVIPNHAIGGGGGVTFVLNAPQARYIDREAFDEFRDFAVREWQRNGRNPFAPAGAA